jgi:dephospho-CoA kinase
MIIGLTGKYASGKSEVARYLVDKKGFEYRSFSGLMEDDLQIKNIPATRENLITISNEMRETKGNQYWAERLLSTMTPNKNYVVESIRNPGEVEALRARPDFKLVIVDAPQKIRYDWMLHRGRVADNMQPFTRFQELEALESKGEKASSQHIDACIAIADARLDNTGTLPELFVNVETLLAKLAVEA